MDPQDFQPCYVCNQTRPCCRQDLLELRNKGHHEKFVRSIEGPLREAWGLGSVWVTCCDMIYGMYYDVESAKYQSMFLGDHPQQAMSRMKHVKSFIGDLTGR